MTNRSNAFALYDTETGKYYAGGPSDYRNLASWTTYPHNARLFHHRETVRNLGLTDARHMILVHVQLEFTPMDWNGPAPTQETAA